MRAIWLSAFTLLLLAACSKSPEEQQLDQIHNEARAQAKLIKDRAEAQAAPLDLQAEGLDKQAEQAGGYAGKRLKVQADALEKQADLLREQAEGQADAVRAAGEARVKALESR